MKHLVAAACALLCAHCRRDLAIKADAVDGGRADVSVDANVDAGSVCDRKAALALQLAAQELGCVVTSNEPGTASNGCSLIDLTICGRSVTYRCDILHRSTIKCWRIGEPRPQGSP